VGICECGWVGQLRCFEDGSDRPLIELPFAWVAEPANTISNLAFAIAAYMAYQYIAMDTITAFAISWLVAASIAPISATSNDYLGEDGATVSDYARSQLCTCACVTIGW
jgi:hypothetical protein